MTQTEINYGIVLYRLGISKDAVNHAGERIKSVPQMKLIFTNPTVSRKKKQRLVERIFAPELHKFLKKLCDNNDFDLIEEIFSAYKSYRNKQERILSAEIFYVTPPTSEQQEQLKAFLKKKYNCREVQLLLTQDLTLIGGFLIKIGSFEYDRSLKGQLLQMEQRMMRR